MLVLALFEPGLPYRVRVSPASAGDEAAFSRLLGALSGGQVHADTRIDVIGGAGFSDQWLTGRKGNGRWRDTMFRIEGSAVVDLQSTFAENWLEASGEILCSTDEFPDCAPAGDSLAVIVDSSPTLGC